MKHWTENVRCFFVSSVNLAGGHENPHLQFAPPNEKE
jgi:hypothetical protein